MRDVEWPDKVMKEEWKDFEDIQLAGVEWDPNGEYNGVFNFMMSNRKKSELKTPYKIKSFMLNLQGKTLRKVQMYHDTNLLYGMKFFDENSSLILEIGRIEETMTEVVL